MCIILKNTSAKYEKMMDELVPPLFDLLKELDTLEKEIFVRNCALNEEKSALNIPSHQMHPKGVELINEYRTRFGAIIDKRVSDKLRSRGYANSFGKPSRYFTCKTESFRQSLPCEKKTWRV